MNKLTLSTCSIFTPLQCPAQGSIHASPIRRHHLHPPALSPVLLSLTWLLRPRLFSLPVLAPNSWFRESHNVSRSPDLLHRDKTQWERETGSTGWRRERGNNNKSLRIYTREMRRTFPAAETRVNKSMRRRNLVLTSCSFTYIIYSMDNTAGSYPSSLTHDICIRGYPWCFLTYLKLQLHVL